MSRAALRAGLGLGSWVPGQSAHCALKRTVRSAAATCVGHGRRECICFLARVPRPETVSRAQSRKGKLAMFNRQRSSVRLAACVTALMLSAVALSASYDEELLSIQRELAVVYKPDSAQTIAAMEALAKRTEAFVGANPGRAEPLIWHASTLTKLSGTRKDMSSLGLAKQARKHFDAAEKLDPKSMDWSANVILAQLYWHVPGWPVGFGDEKHAQKLFERALALNPTGAEPRYFYADFLIDQKRNTEAIRHLEGARTAPLRVGEQPDASGFSCNAMRCMTHTPETDAKFRTAVDGRIAKAREGMKGG